MVDTGAHFSPVERWRIGGRRAARHALLIWPPLALAFMLYVSAKKGSVAIDLAQAYIPAAHKVLHGQSPYPPALTVSALRPHTGFIYPPFTAWLVAPLAGLPMHVVEAVGTVLMIGALAALLWVLDVHDWRCYMIAVLWVPTYSAIQTANVTLPIALGIAVLWRLRDRRVLSGFLVGLMVAIKLYMWPLGVWLLATRRYRSAVVAAVTAPVLVFGSWVPIGFAGLTTYPHLLSVVSRFERGDGYSIGALIAPATSWTAATVVQAGCGLAILAWAWRCARRNGDRAAFMYAIAAMLTLTPIVSMNYFVVLAVVIAMRSRVLSWYWVIPLGLWVGPQVGNGSPWQLSIVLVVVAATIVAAASSGGSTESRRRPPQPSPALA